MPITTVTLDPPYPAEGWAVGTAYSHAFSDDGSGLDNTYQDVRGLPPGLEVSTVWDGNTGTYVPKVQGTPTGPADTGTAEFQYWDDAYGSARWIPFEWTVTAPLEPPTGLDALAAHDELVVTWDPTAGATGYTLSHRLAGDTEWTETPTTEPAATLTGLEPETAYDLKVTATDGTDTTESAVLTVTTEPATEPDPGATPPTLTALVDSLAPVLVGYLGRPGDPDTEALARAQLPVVVDFVRAYTRGNGWTDYTPPYPLRAVIVSAGARLVGNPEQVSMYEAADYQERPAVLNGYTLAELGVLRQYRRIQA